MPQNTVTKALSDEDFARYCLELALQIDAGGVAYDLVVLPLRGAHHVWSLLSYVIKTNRKPLYIDVSRYLPGATTSRMAPEFNGFPDEKIFYGLKVLILDDCTDDGDTMHETLNRVLNGGATLVHTGVVLCKPANLKIRDWRPDFIGWADAPGDIYYDFPGETFEKAFEAAKAANLAPRS